MSKRPKDALKKVNLIHSKIGLQLFNKLPDISSSELGPKTNKVGSLFSSGLAASTLLIWVAFFMIMFTFYFVMSWTPKLLVTAGLSTQQGITGGVLLNVGGIVGTSLIGFLAAKYRLSRLLIIYFLVSAVLMSVFVSLTNNLHLAFLTALALGVFVNGCVAGLYSITPSIYSVTQRVTGLGWAIGIGRSGAILSPLVAGGLIDANWSPEQLFTLYAGAFLLAALAIFLLQRRPTSLTVPQPA